MPGVMGYQNTGGGKRAASQQGSGGGSPAPGSQVKSMSLTQDAGSAPSISGNESSSAATDPIARRYDLLQSNLRGREQAQSGMEQDALARRFASMGASNSGAALRNSQLTANAGAKRMGEQSNVLAAQQSADQQGAIESANARNLQRDTMRQGAYDSEQNRAVQREQIAANTALANKEFDQNQYVTGENLKMAREDQRSNRNSNPISQMLPWGMSMKYPGGKG